MRKRTVFILLCLLPLLLPLSIQAEQNRWCGYALIEGVPAISEHLTILNLLTPDANADRQPFELFQSRVDLAGDTALVEGCWKVYPRLGVIEGLLTLTGLDKETLDTDMTYSLFAPDGSHEDSAASARKYLAEHNAEWELPDA